MCGDEIVEVWEVLFLFSFWRLQKKEDDYYYSCIFTTGFWLNIEVLTSVSGRLIKLAAIYFLVYFVSESLSVVLNYF